eukprot:TRINITY_DN692_c1_g1_i1.p1 TRINITY_DN692_c1_g1~~TRINITY_DN692_c1_g1_i1.p1  ORF type:complete len:326 (-),score=45.52 TRINITY_DN692_c1_g1_i1:247-1224(-)
MASEAIPAPPEPLPAEKIEFARRVVFRQLSDFTQQCGAQTLLLTFSSDLSFAHEFSTADPQELLNYFLRARAGEEQGVAHITYSSDFLAKAPTPLLQLQQKITDLQSAIERLQQEIRSHQSAGPVVSAATVAAAANPVPSGTSSEDSQLVHVPAMDVLSGLADPRLIRLPLWGQSLACLMVYKQILLTGMWRGQPVRVLETMHLDLDLQDGEVYLCTQPWLFNPAAGKGTQKPRHEHHTFKFQRQIQPSKSVAAEVTFRKARCARKKCACSEDAAFELVGCRLTYSTRNLALYHFRKTPINALNIHPRRAGGLGGADDDDDDDVA